MKMEALVKAFPENISEALEIAKRATITPVSGEIQNIVICGMGGSGIGGRIVSGWLQSELKVPVYVCHDYKLPGFVSAKTLIIGSSYSGNTEETLSSVEEGIAKGARLIGICSGGKLQQLCESNHFDVVVVPGGNPPRAALAFSLVQLVNIFSQLGLASAVRLAEIEATKELIVSNESEIKRTAHELASFLKGNVGILYGTTAYEPMLIRARQQFNENSKSLCWHHVLPEMNHNELVGWGGGDQRFATVFFETGDIYFRNQRRLEITKEVISKKTDGKFMTVMAKGQNLIERTIYLINVVDWASLYLAELNNVDPIDIAVIDYLKTELENLQ